MRGYGGGGRGREIIYLSLHCHHQNDSCIKVGSDVSHQGGYKRTDKGRVTDVSRFGLAVRR